MDFDPICLTWFEIIALVSGYPLNEKAIIIINSTNKESGWYSPTIKCGCGTS
jgi:hypothetical protein